MKALVLAPFSEDALEALGRLMPVIYRSWHDSRKLHSPKSWRKRSSRSRYRRW